MTLKILDNMNSSTFRVVWAAEELDLDYELVEVSTQDCATSEQLAALNPNRKIPVIEDNGFVLWESMAITLYLVRKRGGDLAPLYLAEDAKMQMWGLWVTNECIEACFSKLANTMILPNDEWSSVTTSSSFSRLKNPLTILNNYLKTTGGHIIEHRFTIADVNVASVVGWLNAAKIDLSAYAHVKAWLMKCEERPATRKCVEIMVDG